MHVRCIPTHTHARVKPSILAGNRESFASIPQHSIVCKYEWYLNHVILATNAQQTLQSTQITYVHKIFAKHFGVSLSHAKGKEDFFIFWQRN